MNLLAFVSMIMFTSFSAAFCPVYTALLSRGGTKREDQELISSFGLKLRNNFCVFLALSMTATGRQVLVETEKMSSVEGPIRSKQQGVN